MPIVAGIMEVVDTPIYDTVGLPVGKNPDSDVLPAELFVAPIGWMGRDWTGRARVKSELDTNLYDSRLLPAPQRFSVRAIRAALFDVAGCLMPLSGANSRFYSGAILSLDIARKRYWKAPLWKVADPAAMFLAPDVLRGFSHEERVQLIRSLRHQFDDELSPVIDTRQPFSCRVDFDPVVKWDGPTSPAALVVLLEGTLARPVQ